MCIHDMGLDKYLYHVDLGMYIDEMYLEEMKESWIWICDMKSHGEFYTNRAL